MTSLDKTTPSSMRTAAWWLTQSHVVETRLAMHTLSCLHTNVATSYFFPGLQWGVLSVNCDQLCFDRYLIVMNYESTRSPLLPQ